MTQAPPRRRADTRSHTRTSRTSTGHTRASTRTRTQYAEETHGRWVALGLWSLRTGRVVRARSDAAWGTVRSVTTPAGWVVIVWTIAGLIAGLTLGWGEFLVGAFVGLTLLVIALPFLLGREPYEVDFALLQDAVVAGDDARAEIVVRNQRTRVALPGQVDVPVGEGLIDFHVPLLRKGHVHKEPILLPAAKRGIVDVGPATTTRADPLKLLQRTFHWADVQTLYIHPKTISVPSTSMGFVRDLEGRTTRTITSEDINFHAVREYARGDAQRHIHWKSTAKTGTLMVRQFEETRRSTISILLDLADESYANEAEFEMAVSAAGSLAVRAIRDGRDVEVVVSGEVPEFARASVRSLERLAVTSPRRLLDDLSGVDRSPSVVSIPILSRMLVEVSADTSLAFIVTGSHASLPELSASALAFPVDVGVAAVVCDPESEPSMHAVGRTRVLSLGILDDLRQLLAKGAAS
ncbi:DUF58 domain-containing protein [Demequina sp. B12]|uniref:DUF58 domain-containing protein n=1 Tax=Demequina sp. B12 TaxID=2992757 RepID=UPI00237B0AAA|nr:DUF58 domain-containing protein [Demequina sp. B12]MDE0572062.1 DUF58 domain-containing protein [Demequina sp. B12]